MTEHPLDAAIRGLRGEVVLMVGSRSKGWWRRLRWAGLYRTVRNHISAIRVLECQRAYDAHPARHLWPNHRRARKWSRAEVRAGRRR